MGGGGGAVPEYIYIYIYSCSADHERDWPSCKVVFFGLAITNQCAECEKQQFFFKQQLVGIYCEEEKQLLLLHRDSNSRPNVRRFRDCQLNRQGDRKRAKMHIHMYISSAVVYPVTLKGVQNANYIPLVGVGKEGHDIIGTQVT